MMKIFCRDCPYINDCPSGGLPERCQMTEILRLAEIGKAVECACYEHGDNIGIGDFGKCGYTLEVEDVDKLLEWYHSQQITITKQESDE